MKYITENVKKAISDFDETIKKISEYINGVENFENSKQKIDEAIVIIESIINKKEHP